MSAKIIYTLSPAGQKASILAGGDGKSEQTLEVENTDPLFPRVVARGEIGKDGAVKLEVWGWQWKADAPLTAGGVLDALDAMDAKKVADEAAAKESKRLETLDVLKERRTIKHKDSIGIDRDGAKASSYYVSGNHCYETANWPYQADAGVLASPEAVAWVSELATAKQSAEDAELNRLRCELPVKLAAEQAAADAKVAATAKRTAIKDSLGGEAGDYLIRIESGALTDAPCYVSHKRGKNWFAVIEPDPTKPGGLDRAFAAKAKGDSYYILPTLAIGDAVEFGADYYSGSGRKNADRWYGFVVASTAEWLLLRKIGGGKTAYKEGQKWAGTHGTPPVADLVESGLTRINGEGGIVSAPSVN
jgi:hypothetical protein